MPKYRQDWWAEVSGSFTVDADNAEEAMDLIDQFDVIDKMTHGLYEIQDVDSFGVKEVKA